MTFEDRYAGAVRSSNLRGNANRETALDVLGAAGIVGKTAPLAMALERLFVGDNTAAESVVAILAASLVGKAWRNDEQRVPRAQAADIAKAVLAWHRDGVCKPCGGHGVLLMRGAPTLSDKKCPECRGTGKIPFDRQFPMDVVWLARWGLAELEREMAVAGPLAMAKLGREMDLGMDVGEAE